MTKNLKTADIIVKLILALLVMVLYFTNIISGAFANALVILSILVLAIFAAKVGLEIFLRD